MAAPAQASKREYRVVIVGASYVDIVDGLGPDGLPAQVGVYKLARFGEVVELSKPQADRLLSLDAVKPAEEPLSPAEMTSDQLKVETDRLGLQVRGTGANGAPLKEDYVNTLENHARVRDTTLLAVPGA